MATHYVVDDVQPRRLRAKLVEWTRRYLPNEIAGTVGELGGAAIAYGATGSLAAAALVATIGATAGYYSSAYVAAVATTVRDERGGPWARRIVVANLLAMRSVAVEFGPAELVDSIAVRPLAFYYGPLILDSLTGGWIFGKLCADVAFYAIAIFSYERFHHLLAVRQSSTKEIEDHGVVASNAVA